MDFRIAELFKVSRENFKTRDAQHVMSTRQIPDLDWKLEEIIVEIKPVTDLESIKLATTARTPCMYVLLIQNKQAEESTSPKTKNKRYPPPHRRTKEVSTVAI